MTKIGVTGPRGRLGSTLVNRFGCSPLECNITSRESIRKSLDYVKPDVVIHTAALTDVDLCEKNNNLAIEINFKGTANLCQEFNGRIIYISTDYVFDGKAGPYIENDIPFPINFYGKSKFGGENIIRAFGSPGSTIVRTTNLYGHIEKTDFALKVLVELMRGNSLTVPDLWGNPTHVYHLAIGLMEIIPFVISTKLQTPVINISGTDLFSRGEFAELIAEIFGYDKRKISKNKYIGFTPRPIHAGLSLDKANKLRIPLFSAKDGLELMKKEIDEVGSGW